MNIIFFGTPEFAVQSLDAILKHGHTIKGVVTVADKKSGRGQKPGISPVKKYVQQTNIPLLQPASLKDGDFIDRLSAFHADLFIVVAFRKLPEVVWAMPPKGTINLHASLLPDYRGAAPINWAIMNGEEKTGVTTFYINEKIDCGDVLLTKEVAIGSHDNAGDLHDKLMAVGAGLLVETIAGIEKNELEAVSQQMSASAKKAPKIQKQDCRINWDKTTEEVFNFIRGLSPYPGAFSTLDQKMFKIWKASLADDPLTAIPGKILTDHKNYLKVACRDGWLKLEEVQMEGKKKMNTGEFLRGYQLNDDKLTS